MIICRIICSSRSRGGWVDVGDVKRRILVLRFDRVLMLGFGRVQMSTLQLFFGIAL